MRIHFVGIKGTSMSRLAELARADGIEVSGSDETLSGHSAQNARGADLVVYSSAIPPSNPELRYAKRHKIPILSRAQYLGEVCKAYENVFAVCGCHGKTTTATMLYHVLKKQSPTLHVGGRVNGLGVGEKKIFITEACEYKRNFLSLAPDFAIFTNVDFDHPDCYKDLSEVKDAYCAFYDRCGCAIVNADDKNSAFLLKKNKTVSFGFSPGAEFRACSVVPSIYGYSFDVLYKSKQLGRFCINVKGLHNIYNALSALACAFSFGISKADILEGLDKFEGVARRNEYVCDISGTKIFADYAHHPREISNEIALLKSMHKRVLVIFQPHTFSRTKSMFDSFVSSLSSSSEVWILPTYSAREKGKDKGELARAIQKKTTAIYLDKEATLRLLKARAEDFDAVCFMGAGDVYDLALTLKDEN